MEALISQFTFLSDQALQDKDFDPSTIEEDLMKLFEIESYKAWASVELDQEKEVEETEVSMQQRTTLTWSWKMPWMSFGTLKRGCQMLKWIA
ncbi:hypothetical protein SESBI_25940 [Sesbania bispinosa]|nr:hypothetical protein SESBI_25940 [Sesbania bispinosa]